MNDKIRNIVIKYLMNEVDVEELGILENWLKEPSNKLLFAEYLKINYAMDINMNPFDTEKSIKELLESIGKGRQRARQKLFRVFKYAAVFIGIFATTYFFRESLFNTINVGPPAITKQDIIMPGTDKATLVLDDGSRIDLEKGDTFQTEYVNSNGEKLVYEETVKKTKQAIYNQLIIPRGGQYFVKLSDGTKVWLNSETQLKFPVNFIKGEPREVQLVYGEAYFEVSPSTEHNGSRFRVVNQSQEIEVLGTEFNIKAYKDESITYTTLVEGKVGVTTKGKKQNLIPNQQLRYNADMEQTTISVVDVYSEVSWKDGIFSFEDKSLHDIMKVLCRWYDMEVVFENEDIKKEEFFGLLRKDQGIEKIIATIKNYGIIEEYSFKNNTIILK